MKPMRNTIREKPLKNLESLYEKKMTVHASAAAVIFVLFLISCSSSPESGGISENEEKPEAIQYNRIIGKSGGSLLVSDPSSVADGSEIVIPVDALSEDISFSIKGSDLPAPLPQGTRQAGPCVSFHPHGQRFSRKASIYLPYNDSDNNGIIDGFQKKEKSASVYYFDTENHQWEKQTTGYRSFSANRAGIKTEHLSTFLVAVDETSEDTETSTQTTFQAGEYFTGQPEYKYQNGERVLSPVGCIDNPSITCGQSWNLSVLYRTDGGLSAVLDKYTTMTEGYNIPFSDDYRSAVIDVFEYFDKVRESGDAALWTWRVQFEKDHTRLAKYRVLDDASIEAETVEGNKIYANVEVMDNRTIKIGWTIKANEDLVAGDMLVVIFEAVYNGG